MSVLEQNRGNIESRNFLFPPRNDTARGRFAEDELSAYRRALDESAAVAITDTNGIFTDVNPYFCALTGYSRNELIGNKPKLFSSGYHARDFYKKLWETISKGEIWRGEIRNRHKSGRSYWSATAIIPFCDRDGRPYQYVSIRTDISELKEAREDHSRLLESQAKLNRAEEAVLTRDRFLSMASHELKTPLTSLRLKLELALKKLDLPGGALPVEDQKKLVRFALERTGRLSAMIDDMLDVSKIVAGKLEFHFERINLSRLIDEVLNQYHHDFSREGVHVEFSAVEDLWGFWDKSRIEQVIINLLTNALKYGERKPIHIMVERLGESAVIRVRDQGQGMSDEFQKKLFGRFSRERISGIPGSGLGLWITSKIVQAHAGVISASSRLGIGSVFTVELPLHPVHASECAL